MSSTAYQIEDKEKYTLITLLEEKFTAKMAPSLKADIAVLSGKNVNNIIFDLTKAAYCDSSGLSVILVANRICKDKNGCLVICGLSPAVSKLIDISQLTNVLNITPTLNEAIDFVFMDELEKGLNDSVEE